MKITHFGHSCLLVEIDGTRVLFDPGTFSHGFEGIEGLDAILITHQHPDHCDVARLPDLRAIAFNGVTALKLGLRQGLATLGPQIVALPSSSPLHTIGRAAKQPAWDALAPFLAVPR